MVVVDLALATICFLGQCYPALVGQGTPRGEFELIQRLTQDQGYGGDVLQFLETDAAVFAIHRVWLLNPKQKRAQRLASSDIKQRTFITNGCINVTPEVYKKLVDCCSNSTLIVK